jgi:hypothetical protein
MNMNELRDLAAVVTANVRGDDNLRQNLIILIWRDCRMRINFPSGAKMDAGPGRNLDTTIRMAIAGIHHSNEGPIPPKIMLHRVPPALTTNEQILTWMETLPGVAIELRKSWLIFKAERRGTWVPPMQANTLGASTEWISSRLKRRTRK